MFSEKVQQESNVVYILFATFQNFCHIDCLPKGRSNCQSYMYRYVYLERFAVLLLVISPLL